MRKSDTKRSILNDIWIAFGLLTRLPLPEPVWPEARVAANAAWAYPLAGLGVALLSGSVAWVLLCCGLPLSYAAGAALLMSVLATGAMHEDGLADCADGFWGGWDRERRLKIMKDSSTGAYGVSALILAYGLRWAALSAIFAQGWIFIPLIVAAVTSRAGMVLCMATLPNARADGLSSTTGRPSMRISGVACLWAILICGLGFGLAGVIPLIIAVLAAVVWGLVAMRKIGGQTGDVLGATQQICEVAVLGAIAALL